MEKKVLHYFWSHFSTLKTEKQYAFAHKNGEWKAFPISKDETAISGTLDVLRIVDILDELKGADVYIVHNHPSQTPHPSNPDRFQYAYVQSILSLCGVDVEDYLVVSPYGYFSFSEAGYLLENDKERPSVSAAQYIELPNLIVRNDIENEKETILAMAEQYGEMLYHPDAQYGTEDAFRGSFLLQAEGGLVYKNLFFKRKTDERDLVRFYHIDKLLDPIDMYWIDGERIISMKTNICIS